MELSFYRRRPERRAAIAAFHRAADISWCCSWFHGFWKLDKRGLGRAEQRPRRMLALPLLPDPDIKTTYQHLAMQWRELAALFEDSAIGRLVSMEHRRLPPPWSVDEQDMKLGQDCYVVRKPTNRRSRLSLRGGELDRVSTGERSGKEREPVTKVCSNSDHRVDQSTSGCPAGRSSTNGT